MYIAYLYRSTWNGIEQAEFFPLNNCMYRSTSWMGKSCQTKETEMKSEKMGGSTTEQDLLKLHEVWSKIDHWMKVVELN